MDAEIKIRVPNHHKTIVSICMVTYNHCNWIADAIEGVLMQKTAFPFELVISDDCSTDCTQMVIQDYVHANPDLIIPHFNTVNKGLARNFSETLNLCNGKYIAICEGDDFWTDPYKLQKQVDFMEQNPDCMLISHNFSTLFDADGQYDDRLQKAESQPFDQNQFLAGWMTQPLTCLFRNLYRDYSFLNRDGIFCDVILFYEILKHGTGYFLKDNMATFRVSARALSSGLSDWQWSRNHITMFDHLFKYNSHDERLIGLSRKYCLNLFVKKLRGGYTDESGFKPLYEYLKRKPGYKETLVLLVVKIPYYFCRYYFPNKFKTLFR